MTFNAQHPGATSVELTLYHRRDAMGNNDNTVYGKRTLHGCLIDHLNWSTAKGLWDDTETDLIALNIPCAYHDNTFSHDELQTGNEVKIPDGAPMAGLWVIESRAACSADAEIGDTVRLRRKK